MRAFMKETRRIKRKREEKRDGALLSPLYDPSLVKHKKGLKEPTVFIYEVYLSALHISRYKP